MAKNQKNAGDAGGATAPPERYSKGRGISAYSLALETGLVPNTVQRLFRDANDARLSQIMPLLKYFDFEIRRRED